MRRNIWDTVPSQIRSSAAQVRKQRKTNLPEAEFRSATSLATAVLKDTAVDLTTVLETLDTFPAPVIAETARQCWDDLTPQRKSVFVRWISRRRGQFNPKAAALARLRLHPNVATHAFEDRFYDGQADAGAFIGAAQPLENAKNARLVLLGDADPVIGKPESDEVG